MGINSEDLMCREVGEIYLFKEIQDSQLIFSSRSAQVQVHMQVQVQVQFIADSWRTIGSKAIHNCRVRPTVKMTSYWKCLGKATIVFKVIVKMKIVRKQLNELQKHQQTEEDDTTEREPVANRGARKCSMH
jgi:hypothetical protein